MVEKISRDFKRNIEIVFMCEGCDILKHVNKLIHRTLVSMKLEFSQIVVDDMIKAVLMNENTNTNMEYKVLFLRKFIFVIQFVTNYSMIKMNIKMSVCSIDRQDST